MKTLKKIPTKSPRRRSFKLRCPHCSRKIADKLIAAAVGRRASAMRKVHGAGPGRPKKLSKCPRGCGVKLGVAEMRKHRCDL